MLEAPNLLLGPWTRGPAGRDTWLRAVAQGGTHTALGLVRSLGRPAPSWLGWLRGPRLEVLETDDGALLMTLVRPWVFSRLWDVYDAEERRIGTLHLPVLFDNEGGHRAYVEPPGRKRGKLVAPSAHLLADFERLADGSMRVGFAPDLESNPFLRMLLLGAVIVCELPPPTDARRAAWWGRE